MYKPFHLVKISTSHIPQSGERTISLTFSYRQITRLSPRQNRSPWIIPSTLPRHPPKILSSPFSARCLHTTPPAPFFLGRWLRSGRGMRRRIGAWAESIGLVDHLPDVSQLRSAEEPLGPEELFVMPGWAVVKYRDTENVKDDAPVPFDLHVSISGFCSRARPPSRVTRTQRVMLSVVRRFAALPSLPGLDAEYQPMGPIPAAVGMAFMEQVENDADADQAGGSEQDETTRKPYEAYESKRHHRTSAIPSDSPTHNRIRSDTISSSSSSRTPSPSRKSSISSTDMAFQGKEAVATAHENLRSRLAPFWSSILPNRRVLFDIYATPPTGNTAQSSGNTSTESNEAEEDENLEETEPLYSFELITDANGHFSRVAVVPWEKLCTSPPTAATVFQASGSGSQQMQNWIVKVRARLDYEVLPVVDTETSYRERVRRAVATYGQEAVDRQPSTPSRSGDTAPDVTKLSLNTPGEPQIVEWTTIHIGRADGVHIISDLDDTVKHSDILAGPREVFRNVFCRPLRDICVPGMNAMYDRLDDRGAAGFHFVSNSPSQLFPSIRRFLVVNEFPKRHSIKLKYYGGRNIFSSLYESPAERKRASLTDLFEAFPKAKMVMLGDSAEQDLELYVDFAKAHPNRVAAIAIRDVTTERAAVLRQALEGGGGGVAVSSSGLVDEPTELQATSSARSTVPAVPAVPAAPSRPKPSRTWSSNSLLSDEEKRSLTSSQQKILQRAATWQARMAAARSAIQADTTLLFFKDPVEIEETIGSIVDRLS